jgi:thymidylate kinase
VWALLVTVAFLVGVWRQHSSARGVVLYDRHLVDALATLDFAYEGVDLRLQHRLVRAFLPRADVRLYLDVPAEVSVARKPGDVLGEHAVRSQLAAYDRWLDRVPATVRLDATEPAADLVAEALRVVTTTEHSRHKRHRTG